MSGWNYNLEGVCKATNCHFPILESFELNASGSPKVQRFPSRFDFPVTMILSSAPSLRRLELRNVSFASLPPLFSVTTNLVHLILDLGLGTIERPSESPATSLTILLQGMPHLRSLVLQVPSYYDRPYLAPKPPSPTQTQDIVPLLSLTHFDFHGCKLRFEALVAGLSAPSLQVLAISFKDKINTSHLPHLSRFIRDIEGHFFAAQVKLSQQDVEIDILTRSSFIDEQPCKITMSDNSNQKLETGTALQPKLTTLEELVLGSTFSDLERGPPWLAFDSYPWRAFVGQFLNLKILRVQRGLIVEFAHFLSQNCEASPSDLLPALEEIELLLKSLHRSDADISDSSREALLANFNPFVAARQQAGRFVKISWNDDSNLPSHYS
jgi:hypothetical protein